MHAGLPPSTQGESDFAIFGNPYRFNSVRFCSRGTPKQFSRSDLEGGVTREFCGECGTHLLTRRPGLSSVNIKVGTLDEPALFGSPQMAIYTIDKQPFHAIPEGIPSFERLPKR